MLGYAAEEFPGHVNEWSSRVHPEDFDEVTRLLAAHLDGLTPYYRSTHRLLAKDGSWRWILDAGAVVERDGEGRALRAVGTHVDVSESKAAEERFRLLFERSTVPKLLINDQGVIDCNNAAVAALRCRSKESIVGRPLQTFLPRRQPGGGSSREALVAAVRQATEKGVASFRLRPASRRRERIPAGDHPVARDLRRASRPAGDLARPYAAARAGARASRRRRRSRSGESCEVGLSRAHVARAPFAAQFGDRLLEAAAAESRHEPFPDRRDLSRPHPCERGALALGDQRHPRHRAHRGGA